MASTTKKVGTEVTQGIRKVASTQKKASKRALETVAGENARDGITAVINKILPIPNEHKELLKSMPLLNEGIALMFADLINNYATKSKKTDKIITVATSCVHVDLLKKFNLDKIAKNFTKGIDKLTKDNILSSFLNDDDDDDDNETKE